MENFQHQVVGELRTKKSAGLAPGAIFGPVKNLDVLTVDQNPESRPSRCSATFTAKEMPLTKHLIYRDSKSYFLVNFVRKLDTNTKSNHPLLNHWLDSRIAQRKCNVSCHFFIKPSERREPHGVSSDSSLPSLSIASIDHRSCPLREGG